MTYRELLNHIQQLPEDHLDDDVTLYIDCMDEFYAIDGYGVEAVDDVLDEGHLYLILNSLNDDEVED